MSLQGHQGILHHRKPGKEVDNLEGPPQSKVGSMMALGLRHVPGKEVYLPPGGGQLPCDDIE